MHPRESLKGGKIWREFVSVVFFVQFLFMTDNTEFMSPVGPNDLPDDKGQFHEMFAE